MARFAVATKYQLGFARVKFWRSPHQVANGLFVAEPIFFALVYRCAWSCQICRSSAARAAKLAMRHLGVIIISRYTLNAIHDVDATLEICPKTPV